MGSNFGGVAAAAGGGGVCGGGGDPDVLLVMLYTMTVTGQSGGPNFSIKLVWSTGSPVKTVRLLGCST